MTGAVLRLCLDLNIWCGAFLADRHGRSNTAVQSLVAIAQRGRTGAYPVQLVISWGMLTRLTKVWVQDWGINPHLAGEVVAAIADYAHLGPAGHSPYLTLGGTGVMPLSDAEDAHVVETALAARSHLLVTANFDDFITRDARMIVPGQVAIIHGNYGQLLVAHPYQAAAWLRQGIFPSADDANFPLASAIK